MSSSIKVLSQEQIANISAGEVIERPAHVVKELVENALDAGCTTLSIFIEKAGKQLIRIVDNGSGMSRQDLEQCCRMHATSKLTNVDQLQTITSFGFRGEAMASIAAVGRLSIISKSKSSPAEGCGWQMKKEGLEGPTYEEVGAPIGTDISLRDLFYTTPVRLKFLRQDETEYNQIQKTIHAFCLSNRNIHVKLYRDQKLHLNAPPAKTLLERVMQIWGHNTGQNMKPLVPKQENSSIPSEANSAINISEEGEVIPSLPRPNKKNWLTLEGSISQPHYYRYGKQQIFCFVNNRAISDPEIIKAIMKGYSGVLPAAKFPAAVIMVSVDPTLVDINVHPKKQEVRFSKPGSVYKAIKEAVHQTLELTVNNTFNPSNNAFAEPQEPAAIALQNIDTKTIPLPFDHAPKDDLASLEINSAKTIPNKRAISNTKDSSKLTERSDSSSFPGFHQEKPISKIINTTPILRQQDAHHSANNPPQEEAIPQLAAAPPLAQELKSSSDALSSQGSIIKEKELPSRFVGQLFLTYLVFEGDSEIIFLDQHAAHERILYERFKGNFESREGTFLMFPEGLTLTKDIVALLLSQEQFFAQQGINLQQAGSNKILITSSPTGVSGGAAKEVITSAAAHLLDNKNLDLDETRKLLHEHVHSHLACKSAIKAGDFIDQQRAEILIKDLLGTKNRFICVHGRPTMWTMSRAEYEKKFRRR